MRGEDRGRFLNGQVTNDVKSLVAGKGCYAAFTNAKGKMRADVVILNRGDTLFLDLEPGYDVRMTVELEKFIIADDVQVENITSSWNVYTLVGERAIEILQISGLSKNPPRNLFEICPFEVHDFGKGFLFRSRRSQDDSFDLWIESSYASLFLRQFMDVVEKADGKMWDISALEILRVEAGIPRFGVEMNEETLPPEAGIEKIAISYTKGCYIGQEVIARIKSVGHVNRSLVRLKLSDEAEHGDSLVYHEKEVGKLGSVVVSPRFGRIGLAIVRCEASKPNTPLISPHGEAMVVEDF